jgi:hypothetical protein
MIGTVDLPDGCGLAPAAAPGTFLLTSGRGGALRVSTASSQVASLSTPFVARGRWDNHLTVGRVTPPSS